MASHATTINAVPASEGRQQGMYSSTGIGSKCLHPRRGGIGRPLPVPLPTLFAPHAQRHATM